MNAVTCSGEEFKAFWTDPVLWPDGRFMDSFWITVDGLDFNYGDNRATINTITPSSIVVIQPEGDVYDDEGALKLMSIAEYFTQWLESKKGGVGHEIYTRSGSC